MAEQEYDQATIDYLEERRKAREAERKDFANRLAAASDTAPSDYTKLRQLAERSGLPIDVVRRNRERIEKDFAPLPLNLPNAPQLKRLLDGDEFSMVHAGKDAATYAALEELGLKVPAITLNIAAPWYGGSKPDFVDTTAGAWNNGLRQNRINAL